MSAQATMGDWGPIEHVPGEGLDDDPTPRGVVRAVLKAAMPFVWRARPRSLGDSLRVLDVGAGYGCWSSELRRRAQALRWEPHITGIEINPEREEHLAKWCDEVVIAPYPDALWEPIEVEPGLMRSIIRQGVARTFDLIIGNPWFSGLTSAGTDEVPLGMPGMLLEHAPAVLLLHTQQAFLRSEAGRACWRRHPPAASWLVPGSVKFRGPGVGSDARCYQVTLWLRGHSGPCAVHLLDDLTAKERAWSVIPGSESPDVARALGLPMVGDG